MPPPDHTDRHPARGHGPQALSAGRPPAPPGRLARDRATVGVLLRVPRKSAGGGHGLRPSAAPASHGRALAVRRGSGANTALTGPPPRPGLAAEPAASCLPGCPCPRCHSQPPMAVKAASSCLLTLPESLVPKPLGWQRREQQTWVRRPPSRVRWACERTPWRAPRRLRCVPTGPRGQAGPTQARAGPTQARAGPWGSGVRAGLGREAEEIRLLDAQQAAVPDGPRG